MPVSVFQPAPYYQLWLGARRGEPTTEWVQEKTRADVQPFRSPTGQWMFIHNGTIANDKALYMEYGIPEDIGGTQIDSYAIGLALERVGFESAVRNVLLGSFAIVAINLKESLPQVYYATNYKPLYIRSDLFRGFVQVASQRSYLEHDYGPMWYPGPQEIPPYTYGTITPGGMTSDTLYRTGAIGPRKALVVCSGGLDSTTVAWAHAHYNDEVTLLHFKHGARAEGPEVRAVEKLAEQLGTKPLWVDLPIFQKHTWSTLTDPTAEINTKEGGIAGAELAHEWVPARNTVFASLALAIAESESYDIVGFGINLEEAGAFPDNEPEWANKIRALIPYAVKPYAQVAFSTPLANMMKHEIVRMGLQLKVPYEHTWSCYKGEDRHCGTCGPCWNRRTAFEMAGSKDPVFT
jgi:7-cyano-7-deazaguanine synthase